MTPERWQKVKEMFQSALDRAPEERSAFLTKACGQDESLRQEVASLIAAHDREGSFINSPAYQAATGSLTTDAADLKPGQTVNAYEIVSFISRGGMGEVYLARDTRLNREVAIKVLPASVAGDAERLRRFTQEARAVSALNHPNIVTIFEIGAADSVNFIATEFIDGETLRQHLKHTRPKIKEVIAIAIQIADALDAAHEAGIVHRDIKPDNIMLRRRDGYVKVLDFGLAKLTETRAVRVDDEAPTEVLIATDPGTVMGTTRYMSPEQARGLDVDARSDLFSLGIVLYEMMTGNSPFPGTTLADVLVSILDKEPAPLTENASDLPPELDRIVSKCLKKDRSQRYQLAKDLLNDLQSLANQVSQTRPISQPQPTPKTSPSIAVLPFLNMSADAENDYFCDGLAEELLNALAKIEDLKVAARTSTFSFKGKNANVSEIGNALSVETVLEGSVRKSGNRMRITVQLINVASGYHLWSERYDRELKEVFDVQDEITLAVVDALKVKLLGNNKAAVLKRHTDNVEAYQLYLRGQFEWNKFTPEGIARSIEYFNGALAVDPGYAPAYTGLAGAYGLLAHIGVIPSTEIYPKAKSAAEKALALDDTLAEAHAAMGHVRLFYDWAFVSGKDEARRAIELNPNIEAGHSAYAHYLKAMGKHPEYLAASQHAQELDPLSPLVNMNVGEALYFSRRYDDVIRQCEKTLELNPHFFLTYHVWARALEQKGQYAESIAKYKQAIGIIGRDPSLVASLGHVYAMSGQSDEAHQILAELLALSRQRFLPGYLIAKVYAGLGDKDQAFAWLEKSYDDRYFLMTWLQGEPQFDSIRSDPRFVDLVRRIGLPE